MKQEGPEFFDKLPDKEVPVFLLRLLITLPAHKKNGIPELIIQLKETSNIARKYWPVEFTNIQLFNYEEIKRAYEEISKSFTEKEKHLNHFEEITILNV